MDYTCVHEDSAALLHLQIAENKSSFSDNLPEKNACLAAKTLSLIAAAAYKCTALSSQVFFPACRTGLCEHLRMS
jgi:hypothetical protein